VRSKNPSVSAGKFRGVNMTYSRRDFGKAALAGLSIGALQLEAAAAGVTLGVMTYSYRALPLVPGTERVDGEIEALKLNNARDIEFFEAELQPPQKAEDLDKWRKATQLDRLAAMKKKLNAAGIINHAYTVNYKAVLTDDDLDATFQQAKTLGVPVIATSTQVTMAKRLAPFAEKYKIYVAFHGHSNTKDPNEFATPESFDMALATSKYFRINLDIGHFFAAGFDPVAYIQKNHAHITHLHIKDRKKNDGANMPWGEGDTPIKQVLLLLKEKKYPLLALVEYEYRGTGTPVEEVGKCLDYMRKAIA
jgi:sugar phosphate isomerase/epimerase